MAAAVMGFLRTLTYIDCTCNPRMQIGKRLSQLSFLWLASNLRSSESQTGKAAITGIGGDDKTHFQHVHNRKSGIMKFTPDGYLDSRSVWPVTVPPNSGDDHCSLSDRSDGAFVLVEHAFAGYLRQHAVEYVKRERYLMVHCWC